MLNADTSPRVLLVEGQDDEHIVSHLRERNLSMPEFAIADRQSISKLLRAIAADVLAPGRTAVGILVDADEDVQSRWQAVVNRLLRANIDSPERPDPSGTIIDTRPRVGIWLMPNNETPGELEEFVASMIPDGDPVWPLAKEYVDRIPTKHRKFSDRKILRAKVHSWLATRTEPRKMGAAIRVGDLNVEALGAVRFLEWLRRLFG